MFFIFSAGSVFRETKKTETYFMKHNMDIMLALSDLYTMLKHSPYNLPLALKWDYQCKKSLSWLHLTLLGWFESDMTASQIGDRFTDFNKKKTQKKQKIPQLFKLTDSNKPVFLKVKSVLHSILSFSPLSSSIRHDNSRIEGRVSCHDLFISLNLFEAVKDNEDPSLWPTAQAQYRWAFISGH